MFRTTQDYCIFFRNGNKKIFKSGYRYAISCFDPRRSRLDFLLIFDYNKKEKINKIIRQPTWLHKALVVPDKFGGRLRLRYSVGG